MLVKTLVGWVYMFAVAEATVGTFLPPYCWRKCARQAGLACRWEDAECLCKAANNGFLVKTNTCACRTCEDWAFGDDEKTRVQLRQLSAICARTKSPLEQAASSDAFEAATCEGGGSSSPSEQPPAPPPPPKNHPPPPKPQGGPPAPPPKGPPDAPKGPAGPPPPAPGGPKPQPPSTPLYGSKTVVAPVGVATAGGEYDSTVIQKSTILVIPTPLSVQAQQTSVSASATGKGAASKSAGSDVKPGKPASFTGAAVRPDTQWAGSMLALAAGIVAAVV